MRHSNLATCRCGWAGLARPRKPRDRSEAGLALAGAIDLVTSCPACLEPIEVARTHFDTAKAMGQHVGRLFVAEYGADAKSVCEWRADRQFTFDVCRKFGGEYYAVRLPVTEEAVMSSRRDQLADLLSYVAEKLAHEMRARRGPE